MRGGVGKRKREVREERRQVGWGGGRRTSVVGTEGGR